MRKAETILNIIYDRGQKKLVTSQLYRLLYNTDLYIQAYGQIGNNTGAMTKGVDQETVDGMSLQKIEKIIKKVREEQYRWSPVRRIDIPKTNGKTRPLGIPCWSDKLLQEVLRSILSSYYEPQFSTSSHGFRSRKGCHTALEQIKYNWHGSKWFIEGDIKGCFNNIDHEILLKILREKITDNRFLRMISNLLKAGYMEYWKAYPTLSGVPQGGIISPLLANIYMNKLDQFVEEKIIPKYTKGNKRRLNPEYAWLSNQAYHSRLKGNVERAKLLEKKRRSLPSIDTHDPNYKRLKYIRYADDFLLAFIGPKEEAVQIKLEIQNFLKRELKLELSAEKTLVTHATKGKAKFLGYEINIQHCDSKITENRRSINGNVGLRIPQRFIKDKANYYMKGGKPCHRAERMHESDYSILCQYQSEYRGYVQYYKLAGNIAHMSELHWVMQTSLLKTLANKHKSSVKKISKKFNTTVKTKYGPRKCLEVQMFRKDKPPLIARFGGIPLVVQQKGIILDEQIVRARLDCNELVKRLMANACEQCNSDENVEVHHVRKLSDLTKKGRKEKPDWVKLMAAMKRKTLVLCRECHKNLHAGRPMNARRTNDWRAV